MNQCTETVTGFFQDDHRRLDDIFERYQEARTSQSQEALPLFDQLAEGLRRHIGWEEDHLFPLFEERTGMRMGGPTEVMRREHREIERVLDQIRSELTAERLEGLPDMEDQLQDLLGTHNVKEEQVLYPSIDNMLEDAACAELFEKIRSEA